MGVSKGSNFSRTNINFDSSLLKPPSPAFPLLRGEGVAGMNLRFISSLCPSPAFPLGYANGFNLPFHLRWNRKGKGFAE